MTENKKKIGCGKIVLIAFGVGVGLCVMLFILGVIIQLVTPKETQEKWEAERIEREAAKVEQAQAEQRQIAAQAERIEADKAKAADKREAERLAKAESARMEKEKLEAKLSPKEKLEKEIHIRMAGERKWEQLIEVTYDPSISSYARTEFKAADNLTISMTKKAALNDAAEVLCCMHDATKVKEAVCVVKIDTIDSYGKKAVSNWMIITLSRAEWEKADWESLRKNYRMTVFLEKHADIRKVLKLDDE